MDTMHTENNYQKIFKASFFLTAGECNARSEMPLTLITERIIEVATRHANSLGIGYANLHPLGIGWVLSRLGVYFERFPGINESYSIETWIESWNRLFSERCFRFTDGNGQTIGWGRTVWATINFKTRRIADLSRLATNDMTAPDTECGMPRMRKHLPVVPSRSKSIVFGFSDLDFNRHVNSVRYIEHILNLWSLAHYDRYRVERFDIAYHHECLSGQEVIMAVHEDDEHNADIDILRDSERVVTSSIHFIEDPVKENIL